MNSYQIKALHKTLDFSFTAGRPKNEHCILIPRDIMTVTDMKITFSPNHVLKHLKPGKKLDSFHYKPYHSKMLCVVDCFNKYLKHYNTKVLTDTKALFVTYGKPFRVATISSRRRWMKKLFIETSILSEYTPRINYAFLKHLCRMMS